MELLVANLLGKAERREFQGRKYLVAPTTLVVPGVLSGSQGPLLYKLEELAVDPSAWDGMPIIANEHPTHNGQHISARNPDVLDTQGIGVVFNTSINGKLSAEGWIDIDKANQVDPWIVRQLEAGNPLEVSTGLFTNNEPAPKNSVHNGVPYDFIVRDMRPDHLVVLTNEPGACSIQDGCGMLVNTLVGNSMMGFTGEKDDHIHTVRVDEEGNGFAGFAAGHSHLIKRFRVASADGHRHSLERNSLVDDGIHNSSQKEIDMADKLTKEDRKKIVDDLVANCDYWSADDRSTLETHDDKSLQVFHSSYNNSKKLKEHDDKLASAELVANAARKGFQDKFGTKYTYNDTESRWEAEDKPELSTNKGGSAKTEEEWLSSAPAAVREDLAFARNEKARQKEILIKRLVGNLDGEAKAKHAERLLNRSLYELQEDVDLLPPEKEQVVNTPSYFGASVPPTGNQATDIDEDDFLPLPTMKFEKSEQA